MHRRVLWHTRPGPLQHTPPHPTHPIPRVRHRSRATGFGQAQSPGVPRICWRSRTRSITVSLWTPRRPPGPWPHSASPFHTFGSAVIKIQRPRRQLPADVQSASLAHTICSCASCSSVPRSSHPTVWIGLGWKERGSRRRRRTPSQRSCFWAWSSNLSSCLPTRTDRCACLTSCTQTSGGVVLSVASEPERERTPTPRRRRSEYAAAADHGKRRSVRVW